MDSKEQNIISSIYVTVHGLDTEPTKIHLDKNTIRLDGEHVYYDDNKNILLVKDKNGALHMQLILAKAR